jgi:hypothetical protein
MSSIATLPAAPSVTAAVDGLKIALVSVAELVAAGHLEGLSAPELLAVVVDMQAMSSQLEAVTVTAVAEVREGEVSKAEGFTSTTRFLEVSSGVSTGRSRAQVALGEKLRWEFEATQEAWLAGEISEGAVQVITSLIPKRLKGLPDGDYQSARLTLEAMALRHARTSTVAEVKRAIERAAILADPVGAEAAATEAKQSEFLSFTPATDGVEVRGFLTWETAGVVLPCFDQAHDAMFRSGQLAQDDADDLDRLTARTPSLRRKRRQHHNAQIFAELVTRLLDGAELGTKHAQRPHLTVTVHADDFAAGLGGDILLPGFGQVPVPNATIERFLCDAEIHPVLTRRPGPRLRRSSPVPRAEVASAARPQYPGSIPGSNDPPWRPALRHRDGGGWEYDIRGEQEPSPEELAADTDLAVITEFSDDLDDRDSWWNRFLGERERHVLDVGRSRRSAPPKIRRALTIRDGGCAAPGCDVDPSRCEAHHITYWEHLGETSVSNMVLLCGRHHHMVHEGRWQILRNHDLDPGDPGYVTLTAPTYRPETRAPDRTSGASGQPQITQ